MMHNESSPIKLLWTGGWDSTFRLLQCAVVLKAKVQPYYMIDTNRDSILHELRAKNTIKKKLFDLFPFTKENILPTIFYDIANIPENKKISEAYSEITKSINLGEQYEWLARYCYANSINNMELSFEKDDISEKYKLVRKNLKEIETNFGKTYITDNKTVNKSFQKLFSFFEWPLSETSREEMIIISEKYGFRELLNSTWFCHTPIKNKPCGICNPCIQVMESPLSSRLPSKAKLRYRFRGIISKHHFKTKHRKFYNFILKIKK